MGPSLTAAARGGRTILRAGMEEWLRGGRTKEWHQRKRKKCRHAQSKPLVQRIRGSYLAALALRFVAEADEQFIEIVAQAGDGCRIFGFEAVGELACGDASSRGIGGIHDLVQSALDGRLISLFDLVEDVSDLV